MTTAQKEYIIKLHRMAAHYEREYRLRVAEEASPDAILASLAAWDGAETALAVYREVLLMQLKSQDTNR